MTCVHKITYFLVTLFSLLVHRLAPPLLLVSLRHELDQHLFIVKVTDTGATDLSWALGWVLCQLSWLVAHMSVFYGFCFNYLSFQSLIIAVATQNWYLGRSPQTSVPRVLTSLFSTRLTWHLSTFVVFCRHLSSFVMARREVERQMDSQVSTELVFEYLCWMCAEGTQFVVRKMTSANPNPREDLREFFVYYLSALYILRVDFQCEVFQSIYLCLSLGIGVVS